MTLRIAYSANAYMRFPIDESLARIASLGYCGVELMADAPHLWPAETSDATLDGVRAAMDRLSLHISNINAFMMNRIGDARQPYWHPSWIEPNADYRRIRTQHTRDAITMARKLGAACITTEPGGPIESPAGYAEAMNLFVEELLPVVEHAEREGVELLIEPEPDLLIERFDQYLELRERIGSSMLGLNFDIGHAYCVREEPSEWIPKMAKHIRHFHVEDIASTRVHHHLIPGDGAIDFNATLRAIRDINYSGWITVELYPFTHDPDDAGRRAKAHLESIAATL